MTGPTPRQREVFNFVRDNLEAGRPAPTIREISAHFGWASPKAAADHLEALKRKGWLFAEHNKSRALQLVDARKSTRRGVVAIPLLGSIPAGFADERRQDAEGYVSVAPQTLGMKPTPRTFALEVHGDSMIGKHIMDGDVVVLEGEMTPRDGDVVAALIDSESTLKTYLTERGKPFLRAENPKYPKMFPANELMIQGVMVALIRKRR